jgi:hypothetical protein
MYLKDRTALAEDNKSLNVVLKRNSELGTLSQSQSHFMTDSQSVCLSWCRAPSGAHDPIFNSVESYSSVHMGRPL